MPTGQDGDDKPGGGTNQAGAEEDGICPLCNGKGCSACDARELESESEEKDKSK